MKKWLSIVVAGDITSRVLMTLSALMLIRYMNVEEFAKYAVATAFASLCAGALSSGFGSVLVVGFERMKLDKRLSDFLSVQVLIGIGLALLIIPFETYFNGLQYAVGLLLLSNTMSEFARDIDRQQLKFTNYAASSIARSLLFFSGISALVYFRQDEMTALAVVLLQSVSALLVFVPARKHLKIPELLAVRRILSQIYREQFAFFLYIAVIAAVSQLDTLLLRYWSTAQETGAFASAFRVYAIVILVLSSLHKVLLAHLSVLDETGRTRETMARLTKWSMVGIPFIVAAGLLAPVVMPLIDKGKFPEAIVCFQILAVSSVVSLIFSPYVNVLIVRKMNTHLLVGAVFSLAGTFALNSVLIPKYGASGAATAILVNAGVINFMFFVFAQLAFRREKFKAPPFRQTG